MTDAEETRCALSRLRTIRAGNPFDFDCGYATVGKCTRFQRTLRKLFKNGLSSNTTKQ
jgi:hypothetical protein